MEHASRPPPRRLLTVDRLIRTGGCPNARTVAAELEVNPGTARRDLEFLRDPLGAPPEYDARRRGFFYAVSDYALPLPRLSEGELVAPSLAERLTQECRGTP
jgi:predicted DNA-binding transcriptional regulator YafY